jgi:hypothetical protein
MEETRTTARRDPGAAPLRVRGTCHAFFAYDLGFAIDLALARSRFARITPRPLAHQRRRAPAWLQYEPLPLRIAQPVGPVAIGAWTTSPEVECTLYDFGGASVAFRIRLDGPLAELPDLAERLYDNTALLAQSRRVVEHMVQMLGPALIDPGIADSVEDYVVYAIEACDPPGPPRGDHPDAELVARLLLAETGRLDPGLVRDALASSAAYGPDDLTIVNWIAAAVFGPDADDILTVLEHANVELIEMRVLDRRLDELLERSFAVLSRQPTSRIWPIGPRGADLRRLSEARMDSALLFEGVNNAIKLVGDQFLARVYRLAAQRLHLETWDASVRRKLETADTLYDRVLQHESTRRMELLEVVIIILIALSILITFI